MKPASWWKGTVKEWDALPIAERERIAFTHTGCAVAYCTWKAPANCFHLTCQILRGEKPAIALTEAVLAGERQAGWLRFMEEEAYQRLHRAIIARAQESEVYDPWQMPGGWQAIVFSGVLS